jgi:hypothetical protein
MLYAVTALPPVISGQEAEWALKTVLDMVAKRNIPASLESNSSCPDYTNVYYRRI